MYLFIFIVVKAYIGIGKRTHFRNYKAFERYCLIASIRRMKDSGLPIVNLQDTKWMVKYVSMILGDLPVKRERLTFYAALHRIYMLWDIGGFDGESPYELPLRTVGHIFNKYCSMLKDLLGIENRSEIIRLASNTFRFISIPSAICYTNKPWIVMIEELINYLGYYGGHIG